ncbi:MAG: hypothetical protein ISS15_21445 [Alphaproteobacteria bacterium]|nr:hypothetical protein [Alphaproteobacteria bacterium]MBL6940146.1 hypothetical protein [Alphaproteobacteria bacterium]MBL7100233.1 hypothetical protein [Alphaproteobacteria bacterium]
MLTRLATILIASTTLLIPTLACAGASNDGSHRDGGNSTNVLNGQITFGAQWSTVNTTAHNVGGDVVVQSQGAGNVLSLTTFNNTNVDSTQEADSTNIGSTVNAGVSNVYGSVSIQGTAVCNSTDVSTDPAYTVVKSNQICNAQDPGSEVNAHVANVGGDVSIASSAFGNNYTEDTNALSAPTTLHQVNTSQVFGTANATIRNVGGSVQVTGSAIGNNAQIVHYTDNGQPVQ